MSHSRESQVAKAAVLVEALPYIQAFRGQTFLIKVGGSAMEQPDLLEGLLRDVVFLEAVGVNPVLVHGGGKAISRAMEREGLEPRWAGGLRVTDEAAIGVVARVLADEINPALVETIVRFGGRAAGVSGLRVFGGVKAGHTGPRGEPVDLGFVGDIRRVECAAVLEEVARESVPVVTPLAAEEGTGHPLNVNADLAASALAVALRAPKLVYLSDVPGVLRDPSDPETLISTIDPAAFETLVARGVIQGGMLPKVRSALEAITAGVGKVHLIDGRIKHSLLLEVFTRDGIGTQVVA
jgi:acetylglutamate kinase